MTPRPSLLASTIGSEHLVYTVGGLSRPVGEPRAIKQLRQQLEDVAPCPHDQAVDFLCYGSAERDEFAMAYASVDAAATGVIAVAVMP